MKRRINKTLTHSYLKSLESVTLILNFPIYNIFFFFFFSIISLYSIIYLSHFYIFIQKKNNNNNTFHLNKDHHHLPLHPSHPIPHLFLSLSFSFLFFLKKAY